MRITTVFICLAGCLALRAQTGSEPGAASGRSAVQGTLKQVAYLKASNTETNDHFGNGGTLEGHGVAISGDGNTLAVGAPYESSGAKGINGDQSDNSVYSAGAVYVFTNRNG